MKVLLKTPILDYENLPITVPQPPSKEGEEPKEKTMTYFEVITTALNSQLQGETLTAEKKNLIYQLTTKLYREKEPNLTPEQMTLIKEQVGKAYGPLVYGRVVDLIDGVEQPKGEVETPETSPKN